MGEMFGDALSLGDAHKWTWAYIPHIIQTPFYVYAYAFGELLVLALYEKYREAGPAFADQYVDLLRAGGSDYPHELVGRLGIDLRDPEFWDRGLDAIEALVSEAEALADGLGREN